MEVSRIAEIESAPVRGPNDPPSTFRDALDDAATMSVRIEAGVPTVPQHLVLSGGGKWGSFGAGFLHAWPDRPAFQVVTGVSTGALQASFAFLGDVQVPAARAGIYTEANDLVLGEDDPKPGEGRRYIDDLPRAYTVTRSESVILVKGGIVSALRHGSAGDFSPLRKRLALLVDRDVLERIAQAGAPNPRGLYVGVVDVDDGRPYAVDMVDLARRAVSGNFALGQQCYIDVLIASSSEPLQADPVFIGRKNPQPNDLDPRMYIDGGVRAGVFLQEVLDDTPGDGTALPRMNTTIIVNGDLRVGSRTKDDKWRKEWDLLSLAMRSKDILVDQVYQSSVDRVTRFGSMRGEVRLATTRGFDFHEFESGDIKQTCDKWKESEKDLAFPPTFMRCLIDYGAKKAKSSKPWEDIKPAT